jgi:hypothetical protein
VGGRPIPGIFRIMPPGELTARARAVWESLAHVPVAFAPVVRVAVSPASSLCPPGWAGLVVIAGNAIATAPDAQAAQIMQHALNSMPAASVADAAVLRRELTIVEMLGPASLAYLDPGDFQPSSEPGAETVDVFDHAFRRFISGADAGDLNESGIAEISSPAFVIREREHIVAAAGYCDWPGEVAHLSVLTATQARGRGLGGVAASAAVEYALRADRLPQWRARLEASRRIARRLGFQELGSQVSIRLAQVTSACRLKGDMSCGNAPLGRENVARRIWQCPRRDTKLITNGRPDAAPNSGM